LGFNLINMSQDRSQCQAVVNTEGDRRVA